MKDGKEKPFSAAMISALQAVARMKGDSNIAWAELSSDAEIDEQRDLDFSN